MVRGGRPGRTREDGRGGRGRGRGPTGGARSQATRRRADYRDEPPRSRQKLAREFGATDIVEERGDEGVARSRS